MTVKELAIACEVHYNTMRKWLAYNEVQKEGNAPNSAYLITDDVIKKAKKHFLDIKPEPEHTEEKIDNILIQQLTQKDKQIAKQQEQIEHLQKLLENQQILTLKAQERVQLLEHHKEESVDEHEEPTEKELEEPKKENKNLWKRIFKSMGFN